MKKDVFITIKSVQIVDDERDTIELETKGSFFKRRDGYQISYEESEATGFEGSRTTLSVAGDDKVTLIRSGNSPSNLIIERGKKHHCHYGTMFGDIVIGINASKISSTLSDSGGEVYFKYTIDINSSYMSDNEIYVNIKEPEQ